MIFVNFGVVHYQRRQRFLAQVCCQSLLDGMLVRRSWHFFVCPVTTVCLSVIYCGLSSGCMMRFVLCWLFLDVTYPSSVVVLCTIRFDIQNSAHSQKSALAFLTINCDCLIIKFKQFWEYRYLMYLQHDSAYPSHHRGFQCDISGSSKHPNRLWGAPSLPFSGYRGAFLDVGRSEREVDQLLPVPRLRMSGTTPLLLPICIHCRNRESLTLSFRTGAIKRCLPRLCTEHLHETRMGRKSWRYIKCRWLV